jgi:hypothetical protein
MRLTPELHRKIGELVLARGVSTMSALITRLVNDAYAAECGAPPKLKLHEKPAPSDNRLPDDPAELHKLLLGTEPTSVQLKLYADRKTHHGYSGALTAERLTATVVLAVAETQRWFRHRVFVLVPAGYTEAVLAHMENVRDDVLQAALHRGGPSEVHRIGDLLREAVEALTLGAAKPTTLVPPRAWVAVGYSVTDDMPAWLTSELLVVEDPV